MKHPAIQEAWNKRLEFRQESKRLMNEWLDLQHASYFHFCNVGELVSSSIEGDEYSPDVFYVEGERLRAEGKKKQAKSDELNAEGDRIYCEAVIEKYGKKAIVNLRTGEIDV
jgi:hypothetical protein